MMKVPVVELSQCSRCGVCVEACPAVFRFADAGYVEILELQTYPEACVEEAVVNCPERCIGWEES